MAPSDVTVSATVDVRTVNGRHGRQARPRRPSRPQLRRTDRCPFDLPGRSGSSTAVTARLSKVGNANVIKVYDAAGTALTRFGKITISHKYVMQTVTYASSALTRAGNDVTLTLGVANGTTNSIGTTDAWDCRALR